MLDAGKKGGERGADILAKIRNIIFSDVYYLLAICDSADKVAKILSEAIAQICEMAAARINFFPRQTPHTGYY